MQIVSSVLSLQAGNVVHFDLKPQNIYLEPLPGVSDSDFWNPPTDEPPFRVVVGDFGESKMFPPDSSNHTMRPLGTDFMKSPEMLRNGQHTALHQLRENFDRRRHKGAGPPSDVWSLACVLYQLIFNEMLFFDPDYFRFLQQIGFGSGPTIQKRARNHLSHSPAVARLVHMMTERSQEARIDLLKVKAKLGDIIAVSGSQGQLAGALPKYIPPAKPAPDEDTVELDSHLTGLDFAAVVMMCPGVPHGVPPCQALPTSYEARVVQLSDAVLFGSAVGCRCIPELSALSFQCLLVVVSSVQACKLPKSKGKWMDLASALEVPCLHIAGNNIGIRSLRGLQRDTKGFEKVLIVWEPGVLPQATMVAVALMMQKHHMLSCVALARLHRCTLFGKISEQQISILERV